MSEKMTDSDSLVRDGSPREEIVTLKWADALRQMMASCSAYAIVVQGGVNLAFSAVLLPQLAADDSDLYVNTDQASWIASLVTVSTLAIALIVGPLMDKFGRKNIALFTCLPFILSWILVATAKNVAQLYVARIFAGAGAGFSCVSLVYISEICHTSFRPMLLSLNSVAVSLGILLTCALGVVCSWRTLAWIYFVMSVLSLVVLIPLPESPHWLITFSKDETIPLNKISKSLRWLYPNPQVYEQQYSEFLSNADKHVSGSSTEKGFAGFIQVYSKPTVYKPIFILVILFLFQQFSGSYVIIFYALDIFRKISGEFSSVLNEYVSLVLLGAIRLILALVCSILSKRCGRKLMMYVSGIGMAASTFAIVLHSALVDKNCESSLSFLPALFLLLYVCFCSVGYLVIPWGLIGELLPVKVRATMGGVLVMWAYVCMFFTVKMFPSLIESVGVSNVFAFFSAVSFGSVLYIFFFLPETFGKRFCQIEDYFNSTHQSNSS